MSTSDGELPIAQLVAEHQRLHDPEREPRNHSRWLGELRRWQAERLRRTFARFLDDDNQRPAAEFFLQDVYGDRDFARRDADIARVMPMMQRLLPAPLLDTIAAGIELGALTHSLDLDMLDALEARAGRRRTLDEALYAQAYRDVGGKRRRARQIALIGTVGNGLAAALRTSGVATLLRIARGPARAAGLSELQGFLERGVAAFAQLKDPRAFIAQIVQEEKRISRRLLDGTADPFGFAGVRADSRER